MRGLSPGRSRRGRSPSPSGSGLLRRRRGSSVGPPEIFISRSGSFRPGVETLSPLREGPDPNGSEGADPRNEKWGHWLCRAPSVSTSGPSYSRSDLRLLLGVLGAPLAPVHVSNIDPLPHLSIKDTPIVSCLYFPLSFSFCILFITFCLLYKFSSLNQIFALPISNLKLLILFLAMFVQFKKAFCVIM